VFVKTDGESTARVFSEDINSHKVGEIGKESKGGNRKLRIIIYLKEPFREKLKLKCLYILDNKCLKFCMPQCKMNYLQIHK